MVPYQLIFTHGVLCLAGQVFIMIYFLLSTTWQIAYFLMGLFWRMGKEIYQPDIIGMLTIR